MQKARELLTDRQALEQRLRAAGGRRQARPLHLVTNPVQFDETPPSCAAGPSGASTPTRCCRSELGLPMEELLEHKANGVIL